MVVSLFPASDSDLALDEHKLFETMVMEWTKAFRVLNLPLVFKTCS